MLVANFAETPADQLERFFPRRRRQLAIVANERRRETFFVVGKIEAVAALDAEKVIVDAALVAIVAANDLHPSIAAAHAQRGLAAVAAVRADGADMMHLPRTSLVAVRARGERADRADVD